MLIPHWLTLANHVKLCMVAQQPQRLSHARKTEKTKGLMLAKQ